MHTNTPYLVRRALTLGLLLGATFGIGLAQGYNTAVGLRVGRAGGLSVAQRIGKKTSLEGYVATGLFDDGTTATLLWRRHLPLVLKRVNLFVGGGAHKGWNYVEDDPEGFTSRRGDPFGLDGQVGAEVTFGRTNIALDYNVQVNFSGSLSPIRPPGMAVTLRYVLIKRESNLNIKKPWNDEDKSTEKAREKRKRQRQRDRKKRHRQKERGDKPSLRERVFGSGGDALGASIPAHG